MNAIDAIAAERQRQIEAEGYTPEHDDDHEEHVFVRAAAAYALGKPVLHGYGGDHINLWPWWPNEFKHADDRRRQLVIAGALVVAAIERLDRGASAMSAGTAATPQSGAGLQPASATAKPGRPNTGSHGEQAK